MPAQVYPQRGVRVWVHGMVAVVAIGALMAARNGPPNFPAQSSVHSTVSAVSNHNQRPHFDFDELRWSAPVRVFFTLPPASVTAQLASPSNLFPSIPAKGSHYKRPPPIS